MPGIGIIVTEGYRVPGVSVKMPDVIRVPVDNVAKLVRWIDRCRLDRVVDSNNDPVDRVDHHPTIIVSADDIAIHANTSSLIDVYNFTHSPMVKPVPNHWF